MNSSDRYPMRRHGHLHYQVRALSPWCAGARKAPGALRGCDGPFLAMPGQLIGLCTCDCHLYNHSEAERRPA